MDNQLVIKILTNMGYALAELDDRVQDVEIESNMKMGDISTYLYEIKKDIAVLEKSVDK